MRIRFRAPANRELDDAVAWYETRTPGLGKRFAHAVAQTIARIALYPEASPLGPHECRCALVSDFPYGIWYLEHGDALEIFAVAHLHRDPTYWLDRL